MSRLLACRLAFLCLPILRCRPCQATMLLGLLSLVPASLVLRAPAGSPPLELPGVPMGLAVDAAAHSVVLTTVATDTALAIDSSGTIVLGAVSFGDGLGTAMAVDPGSGYIYVASAASRLVVLASPISTPHATIDLDPSQAPVALAVNPVTGRVYAATLHTGRDTTGDLVVMDGPRYTILAELPLGHGSLRVAVDPATNRVFVTDDGSNTLTMLDGATNALLGTLPLDQGHHELAVNGHTGRVYVTDDADHNIAVLDGTHGLVLDTVPVAGDPGAVAVNEWTDRVYVATDAGNVTVLDGKTNRLLATVPVGPYPARLAVDASSSRVYVTDTIDSTVWLLQDRRFGRPTAHLIARMDKPSASPVRGLGE